jgi:hypothetical protein
MTGPSSDFPIYTGPYIIFSLVLGMYFYFIFPAVIDNNALVVIGFIVSFVITIIFMLLSSCTDPGVIPKRPFL